MSARSLIAVLDPCDSVDPLATVDRPYLSLDPPNVSRPPRTSNFSSDSDVDHVREATDLVKIVGEHVVLRPKGREHVGLCPFHDDRTPSFAVVTHKGDAFYKCFACGAAGDCFTFVMNFHKMDFPEALRYLADRSGIVLTPRRPVEPGPDGEKRPERGDLLRANAFAATYFRELLLGEAGDAARTALADRGISDAMSEAFQLGYAPPGYDGFVNRLGGKTSAVKTATAAGLLRTRESGGQYDTFRNRLIFPIADEVGRPIAFGGRIIDPEDTPKYLNSPESAVFHKSRTLYGLHLARRAIIRERTAIVTEGYTDVIACHQAGIENVIGTLGTALTAEHAGRLSRLCDTVVLLFDGDEAGQRAADRGVEVFFREPVDVKICVLPNGLDPDDLLREPDGDARFRVAVESAQDALDYKLSRFQQGLNDGDGLSARQRRAEEFLQELAELGVQHMQGVRRAMVLGKLAELLALPLVEVERALAARRTRNTTSRASTALPPAEASTAAPDLERGPRNRRLAERTVLGLLAIDPAAARLLDEPLQPQEFSAPSTRELSAVLLAPADDREIVLSHLLDQLTEQTRTLATDLFMEARDHASDESNTAAFTQAVDDLRTLARREAHLDAVERLRISGTTLDAERAAELIQNRRSQDQLPAAILRGVRISTPTPRTGGP